MSFPRVTTKKSLISNEHGVSIVTALMGAAIGVIVMAGLITMVTNIFKSQRTAQSRDANRELVLSVRQFLSDPTICTASFGGGDPHGLNGFTRNEIKNADSASPSHIKYQVGQKYFDGLVRVVGFQVKNYSADNTDPNIGKAELVIKMEKIGTTVGSTQLDTTILLQTTLIGGNILGCYSIGGQESLWQISSANMANIFYNMGNVGIGTTNPFSSLEILGDGISPGSGRIITTNTSSPTDRWPGVSAVNYLGPGGSGAGHPTYFGFNSRGTSTAPLPLQANDRLLVLSANGGIGSGLSNQSARIDFIATSNWSAASAPSAIYFSTTDATTPPGPASYQERMRIDPNGNVGIGTASPSYTLHVNGTAGLSSGTSWSNASDIRLKDIKGDYDVGLDEVLKLHTVRYSYKKNNPLGLPSDFTKTGFVAQEVQKIIPDAVTEREDGYLEINVDPIHWAVVNSINDLYFKYVSPLQTDNKKHEQEIASLKKVNSENTKKIEALENALCELGKKTFCHQTNDLNKKELRH